MQDYSETLKESMQLTKTVRAISEPVAFEVRVEDVTPVVVVAEPTPKPPPNYVGDAPLAGPAPGAMKHDYRNVVARCGPSE